MLEFVFVVVVCCFLIVMINIWSDGSWLDIELLELESLVEDDWFMVDEDDV